MSRQASPRAGARTASATSCARKGGAGRAATPRAWRVLVGVALTVAVLLGAAPREARADGPRELAALAQQLEASRGAEAYALLRGIFALWDVVDPDLIEPLLVGASESRDKPAQVRQYADVLVAEARRRRGDFAGAAARMSSLGFVDRWLFVGPFDDENRVGLASAYQPEVELREPIVFGRAFDGKERAVRWRAVPQERSGAILDFGDWMRPREQACAYATTFLKQRADRPPLARASLWVGTEGAFKIWWNGASVLEDSGYRGFDFDRFAVAVDVRPGVNRLTVKVCSDAAPRLAVRLADEKGDSTQSLEASADPAAAPESQVAASPVARPTSGVSGPVQTFERVTAGPGARAADLEAYARYLQATRGNPRGEHRARDLARRAAESEPTWARLLLAADLAEDRNQAIALVAQAKSIVPKHDVRGRVAATIAEARLARTSIHGRDAVPHFDRALALDPDSVVAALGRTELFVQAGLPHTALGVLEDAVARSPRASALLRVYSAQLRSLGRDTEADEVDARWYAFRADDAAFASQMLDRAVARRDAGRAERWIAALRRAEPDIVFADMAAARAYRSLGEKNKARRALESALEVAPEDDGALRALADLAGENADRDGQLRILRRLLAIHPQNKDVRAYVEYLAPARPRDDEAQAFEKDALLALAKRPPGNEKTRILRKLAVVTVFPNGLASRFYQVAYQPLTDEAAAEARQFITQYEGSKQAIELRAARIFRADGGVAEAVESGESAANNPAMAMYTSVRAFAVTLPRVSPGDVVEVRYRIDDVSARNEVADSFYDIEFLQDRQPVLSSELVVVAPKSRPLTTFVHALPGVKQEVTDHGSDRRYRFLAENVAPLIVEPNMPPDGEVLGQVHLSTFGSWDELARWYYGLARDQLDVDDEVRKKVREITGGLKDDDAKVRAVYRYVTLLRYVALELGIEGIKPRRCALTLARGWGDCKDKATVIVTMLRELGIPAHLVLVRTSQRGDLPAGAPPSLAAFDHAIAYVPSLDLYLDGTAEGAGSRELPAMDRGAVALVVTDQGGKLTRLPDAPAAASLHTRKIEVSLVVDGSAGFAFESSVGGVNAAAWRSRYHAEGTRRDRAARDLSTFLGTVEVAKDGVTVRDADDVERPIRVLVKGRAVAAARKEGDALSVPVASTHDLVRSLASLGARRTDLIVGALSTSEEERTIRLPPGMKVRRLPEAVQVSGPFGQAEVRVRSEPGKLVVTSKLALTKSRVSPASYAAFREFCEKADAALSQRLVLGP